MFQSQALALTRNCKSPSQRTICDRVARPESREQRESTATPQPPVTPVADADSIVSPPSVKDATNSGEFYQNYTPYSPHLTYFKNSQFTFRVDIMNLTWLTSFSSNKMLNLKKYTRVIPTNPFAEDFLIKYFLFV